MKTLIAVVSCCKYRNRADAQRSTWVPLVQGADVRFFVGNGPRAQRHDEIQLDVRDGYHDLAFKVREVCRWALAQGYDYVFKTDDDVYIQPDRLLFSPPHCDYKGRVRPGTGGLCAPYASGFAYWLSRHSLGLLATARVDDWAEDRWVGNTLERAGVLCAMEDRYKIIKSRKHPLTGTEGPRQTNDVIVAAELDPKTMKTVHEEWFDKRESA